MKHLFTVIFAWMTVLTMQAQVEYSTREIDMQTRPDGRVYICDDVSKKPLNGKIRLVTNYSAENIDLECDNGYPDGKWIYYKNGVMRESKVYTKGYLNGESIKYFEDGKTIAEKYPFKDGKINGMVIRYLPNGKLKYEKGMKDGVDDGPERNYNDSGELYSETIFKDGKATGKSFSTTNKGYPDEYTTVKYYKNSELDGKYTETYADGSIKKTGSYIDGKKSGVWEAFKSDGLRAGAREEYKEDKVIKKTTYFTNGNIETETNYDVNGKKDGVEKKYDLSGMVKSELNYVAGKQVGKQVRYVTSTAGDYIETSNYNSKGQKDGSYTEVFVEGKKITKTKGQYLNGEKHGKWIHANYNSEPYKEENYDNGKLLDSKRLDIK